MAHKKKKSKPRKSHSKEIYPGLGKILDTSLKAGVAIGVTGVVMKAVK